MADDSLFTHAKVPLAPLDHASRLACLRLIRSQTVGPVAFQELINLYGGAQAALDALPGVFAQTGRSRFALVSMESAERELDAAARAGCVPLFTIEPGYPAALSQVEHPPPLVYVRGRHELLSAPTIAIVGSRLCSAAGLTLTRRFAEDLGQQGFVIASGLARGIDAAAHESALDTGTVAVMAGGIDRVYPSEHLQLAEKIAERGCLVSEMPPGHVARAKDFPRRNRIISGMALGVLVIEAAKRSGTLITARTALEQNREVFAVPGHPLDPRAEGTNQLLKKGEAKLVTCAADILADLGPITGRTIVAVRAERPPEQRPQPLPRTADADIDAVILALGFHPTHIDDVVRTTALDIRAVQVCLMELDLAGRIERHGGQLVSLRSR